MINRYLFRGKRNDNGEWIVGDFSRRKSRYAPQLDEVYGISNQFGVFCAVDHDTVGQCTGLKDKNGKLIFEGDIVKVIDKGDTSPIGSGKVKWVEASSAWAWFSEEFDVCFSLYGKGCVKSIKTIYEVIGNIYEKSEFEK